MQALPPLARLRARIPSFTRQNTTRCFVWDGRQGCRHSAARAAAGANPIVYPPKHNSLLRLGWEAGMQALRRSRAFGLESHRLPAKTQLAASFGMGGRDAGTPPLARLRARIPSFTRQNTTRCFVWDGRQGCRHSAARAPSGSNPIQPKLSSCFVWDGRQECRRSAARAPSGANPIVYPPRLSSCFVLGWEAGIQALRRSRAFGRESHRLPAKTQLLLRLGWEPRRPSVT